MKLRGILFCMVLVCLLAGCTSNIKEGVSFLEEGDYSQALACFAEEVEADKNLGEAYRGMGIAQYELGNYEDALASFQNALDNQEKETASLLSLMAACSMEQEDYESALNYYESALTLSDCKENLRQEILYNEIAAYEELGEWDTVREKALSYQEAYPEDDRLDKTMEFLETR